MFSGGLRMVLVTRWAWPFGGGEEFMLQSMAWCQRLGIEAVWLDFADGKNQPHPALAVDTDSVRGRDIDRGTAAAGAIVHVPGGFDELVLENWLRVLQPDIVHHQGHKRLEIAAVCRKLRIPIMTGVHFWIGIVDLAPETANTAIIANARRHKASPELPAVLDYCHVYAASTFVQEAVELVTGHRINSIIYPISSADFALAGPREVDASDGLAVKKQGFITMINIHANKGGALFLELIRTAQPSADWRFWGIHTEWLLSDELDKQLRAELTSRSGSRFWTRTDDVRRIYSETEILLVPSLVDETFCRVAYEGMLNGIPILTTGAGNIVHLVGADYPYLLPDASPANVGAWRAALGRLLSDRAEYARVSTLLRERARLFDENVAIQQFTASVQLTLDRGGARNIMIFCPWGDQGLGLQSRNYVRALESCGMRTHIFSFRNYNQKGERPFQKNAAEWEHPQIFYSPHNREEVTDAEVVEFVERYNIRHCLIPETCWFRVFEIARLLKSIGVNTIAVPNVEIVREDEISRHRYFKHILCNNNACYRLFESRGFRNIQRTGYAIDEHLFQQSHEKCVDVSATQNTRPLRFVLIGGTNAFSRKQALQVIEAYEAALGRLGGGFPEASVSRPDGGPSEVARRIELTITVQTNWDARADRYLSEEAASSMPGLKIIRQHLEHAEILELIRGADIVLQVSRQEGLGLGFFESLACGRPCLTLDTEPHREVVKPGKYGWSIPCTYEKMTDNPFGLIQAAVFKVDDLADEIARLALSPADVAKKTQAVQERNKRYREIQHYRKWSEKFTRAVVPWMHTEN